MIFARNDFTLSALNMNSRNENGECLHGSMYKIKDSFDSFNLLIVIRYNLSAKKYFLSIVVLSDFPKIRELIRDFDLRK